MAYQETANCSSVPYKCLHIISSELYNSLIEKTECSDDGNSHAINTYSNSSPSFQNNFYPQNNLLSSGYHGGHNRFDGNDDDDNAPGPHPRPQLAQPSPSNLTPNTTPIEPSDQHYSETSPQHFSNSDGATSNIDEPVDDLVIAPNIDSKTNDTITQSAPSHPPMFKEKITKRNFVNKKPYNIKPYKSSLSSTIPKKEEPMETSLVPSVSNIPSSSSQVIPSHSSIKTLIPSNNVPKLSISTSKIKDEVKWKPHNKHQEVKIRKPIKTKPEPKKRIFKFERNIPKIEDDPNDPMDGTFVEHIPLNENDEKMDIDNFKFRRDGSYANTFKNRKYPKLTRKQDSVLKNISNDDLSKKKSKAKIKVRTDLIDKMSDEVVKEISKDDVLKQISKPKIRVRTDLFKENPSNPSKKNVKKKQVYIHNIEKDKSKSLREKNKKEIAKNVRHFFEKDKSKSLREKNKKEIAKNVRNFFAKNKQANIPKFKVPPKKKSQFNDTSSKLNTDFEMGDDSKIKIEKKIKPDNDSKALVLNKRKIKKEIIEKSKNTKLSRDIKKEMIEEEMTKSKRKNPFLSHPTAPVKISKKKHKEIHDKDTKGSKRKNLFGTHPTGPIKFVKKDKDTKGSKRKNLFGTHPTGPIKFVKKNIREKNGDSDDDNKDFKKKFSGSGFNMWKIKN